MLKIKNLSHLEMHAKCLDVDVDYNNPRETRLKLAMMYHEKGKYPEAVGVMKGEMPDENDLFLIMTNFGFGSTDPKTFYGGFPEVDEPDE
jgi:hypothetical protein